MSEHYKSILTTNELTRCKFFSWVDISWGEGDGLCMLYQDELWGFPALLCFRTVLLRHALARQKFCAREMCIPGMCPRNHSQRNHFYFTMACPTTTHIYLCTNKEGVQKALGGTLGELSSQCKGSLNA